MDIVDKIENPENRLYCGKDLVCLTLDSRVVVQEVVLNREHSV